MNARFAVLISPFPTMQLALDLNISPTAISQWKTARSLPAPAHYEQISKVCLIPINEIAAAVGQDHVDRAQARRDAKKRTPKRKAPKRKESHAV